MAIKIHPVSGFDEVGKTMIVTEVGDDAFAFDMGLYIPALVQLEENRGKYTEKLLRSIKALPDDLVLNSRNVINKIRGILIGHAHLDHVGGVPFLENRYNANVYGTPFTTAFLEELLADNRIQMKNKAITVPLDTTVRIKGKNKDYEVEFINITHSTIQTAIIAVHTPSGIIVYANDFKMDDTPVLGQKPNYQSLKRLAKEGVKLLIIDCLYSREDGKTPSEEVAREKLRRVLNEQKGEKNGLFVTTFSSHIARLKSITEFGKKINREVLFLGRSLNKYTNAAKKANSCPYQNDMKNMSYSNQVLKTLKMAQNERGKYLIVCTGHQGEKGSILDRIARGVLPYKLTQKDHIVFSSRTIPTPETFKSKEELLKNILPTGATVSEDIHVSGHGQKEDLKQLIELLQPEHIIPSHGHHGLLSPVVKVAQEIGYVPGKTIHLVSNGQELEIK
ncbi:MAG: MBL fold metallo-hydrolase [Nanoarchaeota archaeon]